MCDAQLRLVLDWFTFLISTSLQGRHATMLKQNVMTADQWYVACVLACTFKLTSEPTKKKPVPPGRGGGPRVCQGPHVTLHMKFFF